MATTTDVDYGVHVSNKFQLFLDDDHDPLELLAQQTAELGKKDAKAKAADAAKKKGAKSVTATATVAGDKKKPGTMPVQKPPVAQITSDPSKGPGQAKVRGGRENAPGNVTGQQAPRGDFGQRGSPRGGGRPRQDLPPRFHNNDRSAEGGQQRGQDGTEQSRGRGGGPGRGFGVRRGGGGFYDQQPNRGVGFGGGHQQQGFGDASAPIVGNEESYGYEGEDRGYRGGGGGGYRGGRGYGGRGGRGGGFHQLQQNGGGAGGLVPRGGRQYDRISGSDKTGVKATEKRDGAGPFNWGTAQDELVGDNEGLQNATAQSGDLPPAELVEGDERKEKQPGAQTEDAAAAEKQAEEEAKQMTFDEWKASKAPAQKPSFNVRKPGEGESDKAEWKRLKPLPMKREKDEDNKDADEGYEEDEDDGQKKKKDLPIRIMFSDDIGGGRGRGGGRGGGGYRGGGGGRNRDFGPGGPPIDQQGSGGGFGSGGGERRGRAGQQQQQDVPYKMDEESFPSLGAA